MTAANLLESLRMHGLEADAYAGQPVDAAQKHLLESSRHYLVVCSQPEGGNMGHAVVYGAKPSGVALYDDTKDLEVLDWVAWRKSLKRLGSNSVFIFVSCPERHAGGMSERIQLAEPEIRLGVMEPGVLLERSIEVHNMSNRPVTIAHVKTPCSCIEAELSERTIAADTRATLHLTVTSDEWGEGIIRKDVALIYPDRSKTLVPVYARLRERDLRSIPRDLMVAWLEGTEGADEAERVRHLKISVDNPELGENDYRVVSTLAFLEVSKGLVRDEKGSTSPVLDVEVRWPDPATILADNATLTGTITVECAPDSRKVDIPVVFERQSLFTATPGILTTQTESTRVVIRPRQACQEFCVESVSAEGYDVKHQSACSSEKLELEFLRIESAKPEGPAVVGIRVQGDAKTYMVAIPIVRL
jgi:hypothetical protein